MERPLPVPCAHDKEFWDAVSDGRLLAQKTAGGRWQAYPRAHALDDPMRPNAPPSFALLSGCGRIESFSVVHRSFYPVIPAPYAFAIVRLDEGILMTGHLVEANLADLRIGDRVEVTFVEIEKGVKLPCFMLAGGERRK